MKKISASAIVALLTVLGTITAGRSEIVDSVVAVVNGEVITLSMVEDAMNAVWTEPGDLPGSRQDALQKLINRKLELQEARRMGIGVVVSEESLSSETAKVLSRFASPEEFSLALKQRGITQDALQKSLIEEIMIREMVNRKFYLFVEVTDLEASDFFEQNREKFVVLESVHLSQIYFQLPADADEVKKEAVRKKAEDIFEKLRNGADFSTYIGEEKKGDYTIVKQGYISIDRLPFPALATAVSRLEVEGIDLIEAPDGYFIVKLNDRRPTRQANFHEVKEEIKTSLSQKQSDDEFRIWLQKQRESADIRIRVYFRD